MLNNSLLSPIFNTTSTGVSGNLILFIRDKVIISISAELRDVADHEVYLEYFIIFDRQLKHELNNEMHI